MSSYKIRFSYKSRLRERWSTSASMSENQEVQSLHKDHLDQYWRFYWIGTIVEIGAYFFFHPDLFTLVTCFKTTILTFLWMGRNGDGTFVSPPSLACLIFEYLPDSSHLLTNGCLPITRPRPLPFPFSVPILANSTVDFRHQVWCFIGRNPIDPIRYSIETSFDCETNNLILRPKWNSTSAKKPA